MNKVIGNPLINIDPEGITDNCVECQCLLTDYEKDTFNGVCGSCYNDLFEARNPKLPDRRA